jgi:hypothetical protein
LKVEDGVALGALCVLHDDYKDLSVKKKEMLEIIACEVVNRIKIHQAVTNLKKTVQETNSIKNKVAHDFRGPIGGSLAWQRLFRCKETVTSWRRFWILLH